MPRNIFPSRAIQGNPISSPTSTPEALFSSASDDPRLVSYKRGGVGSTSFGGNLSISKESLQELDDFISANQSFIDRLPILDDILAQTLSGICDAYAHKWSGGPIRTKNMGSGGLNGRTTNFAFSASRAWSFPVPRLTGDFYAGWKKKRLGIGMWLNYNQTREAYFIEYGIHTSGKAVRRPVMKKSVLDTLEFIASSGLIKRFADDAIEQVRNTI